MLLVQHNHSNVPLSLLVDQSLWHIEQPVIVGDHDLRGDLVAYLSSCGHITFGEDFVLTIADGSNSEHKPVLVRELFFGDVDARWRLV